jgi:hypothetical protein
MNPENLCDGGLNGVMAIAGPMPGYKKKPPPPEGEGDGGSVATTALGGEAAALPRF